MRFLARIVWWLRQLLPLIYRTYYADELGNVPFAVWRMWFGRCFAIDDVVVDPFVTVNNKAVAELEAILDEAYACDGDCENCLLGDMGEMPG